MEHFVLFLFPLWSVFPVEIKIPRSGLSEVKMEHFHVKNKPNLIKLLFFNSSSQKSSMIVWLPRLARSFHRRLESRCVGEGEEFLLPIAGISSSSCRVSRGTVPLCPWSLTLKSSKAFIWQCSIRWAFVGSMCHMDVSTCLRGKKPLPLTSALLWHHQGLKPQSFRNPYDIPRSHLLDQLSRMRRNLLNTSVCNLRGQDSGRSLSISKACCCVSVSSIRKSDQWEFEMTSTVTDSWPNMAVEIQMSLPCLYKT